MSETTVGPHCHEQMEAVAEEEFPASPECSAVDMLEDEPEPPVSKKRKHGKQDAIIHPSNNHLDKASILKMLSNTLNLSNSDQGENVECVFLLLFVESNLLLELFQEVQKVLSNGVPITICKDSIKIITLNAEVGIPVDAQLMCKVLVAPPKDNPDEDYLIMLKPSDIIPYLADWQSGGNPVCLYSLDGTRAHMLCFQSTEKENIPHAGADMSLLNVAPEESRLKKMHQSYAIDMQKTQISNLLKIAVKQDAYVLKFTIRHSKVGGSAKPRTIALSIQTEQDQSAGKMCSAWRNFISPITDDVQDIDSTLEEDLCVHYEQRFFVGDFKKIIDYMKQTSMQLIFSSTTLVISHPIGQDGSSIKLILMCQQPTTDAE